MKKSQVLAALALAFALGVVAPVAGVMNASETYAVESRAVESATDQDVYNAVAKINNYATYKKFATVFKLVNDYSNEDVLKNDTATISSTTATQIKTRIENAVNTVKGSGSASYANLSSAVNAAIVSTTGVENYGVYAQLVNYLAQDDEKISAGTIVDYIKQINSDRETTIKQLAAIDTNDIDTLRNFVNGTYGAWSYAGAYANYYAVLVSAVNDGNTYLDFVKNLKNALNEVQEWTGANKDAVKNAAADTTDPADELVKLATDANIEGYAEYSALYSAIKNIEDGTTIVDKYESGRNRNTINNLNTLLETASDVVPGEKVSLKDLPAVGNTDGTGEGTNKPGDDKNEGNKAPNTGILAGAEGSASTTVAMVAGVATALTAAGAGVVAYRNARRSTRK